TNIAALDERSRPRRGPAMTRTPGNSRGPTRRAPRAAGAVMSPARGRTAEARSRTGCPRARRRATEDPATGLDVRLLVESRVDRGRGTPTAPTRRPTVTARSARRYG